MPSLAHRGRRHFSHRPPVERTIRVVGTFWGISTIRSIRRLSAAVLAVLLVVCFGLFAACGGDDDGDQSTEDTAAKTSESTTTTEKATTTTLSEAEADEAEARELMERFPDAYNDMLLSPDPHPPEIEEFFTGAVENRFSENQQDAIARGETTSGLFRGELLSLEVEEETGSASMCILDAVGAKDASGGVLIEPDSEALVYRYDLRKTAVGWRIEEMHDTEEHCELEEAS